MARHRNRQSRVRERKEERVLQALRGTEIEVEPNKEHRRVEVDEVKRHRHNKADGSERSSREEEKDETSTSSKETCGSCSSKTCRPSCEEVMIKLRDTISC